MDAPRVLVFGSFDPLHEGHRDFFRQAKALGSYLIVIVARDTTIRTQKKHAPSIGEEERRVTVAADPAVDEARLGTATPDTYGLLTEIPFDILAVGYDQQPSDARIRELLTEQGRAEVQVVRLAPYQPEQYKSSLLRS